MGVDAELRAVFGGAGRGFGGRDVVGLEIDDPDLFGTDQREVDDALNHLVIVGRKTRGCLRVSEEPGLFDPQAGGEGEFTLHVLGLGAEGFGKRRLPEARQPVEVEGCPVLGRKPAEGFEADGFGDEVVDGSRLRQIHAFVEQVMGQAAFDRRLAGGG